MQYASIGGISSTSRIVLGTDSLRELESGFRVLDEAIGLGINTLDTARVYGTEATIGRWMETSRRRSDVTIITKGGFPGQPTAARIHLDCESSLRALRTDNIDCYLLHYDCETVDVNEMISALDRLRLEGKIRTFGLANFCFARVQHVVRACSNQGIEHPTIVSAHHGLLSWVAPLWPNAQTLAGEEKSAERAWYESRGYNILAYSPLGRGFFKAKAAGLAVGPHFDCPANHERYRRANELAKTKGACAAQIALAFLLNQSAHNFAIIGCRDLVHLRLNAAAADITLSSEEIAWIDLREAKAPL
jgi:aryl-alcohol dehydrogenase-like predicted oxidoreductase